MKKILALLLVLCMLFSMVACSNSGEYDKETDAPNQGNQDQLQGDDKQPDDSDPMANKVAIILQEGGLGDQGYNDGAKKGFDQMVEKYGIDGVLVEATLPCGLRTNLDCRATAIDATSHDLVSYIVSDLTQTDCEETKQFHLREMSWYFSLPLTTAEIHARLADGRL